MIIPVFLAGLTFIILLKKYSDTWPTCPLDMNKEYNGKRIFGKNKTLRGPVIMGFFTGFYGLILSLFFGIQANSGLFLSYMFVGIAYSAGELPNSFVKRQLGIPPGELSDDPTKSKIFKLTDNFDSLLSCGIMYALLFNFSLLTILVSIMIGGLLHFFTDKLMILLGIKKKS